jgi:hypothetical protein
VKNPDAHFGPPAIAEKCGFVLEGTVRGAFFNDGHHQDVLLYSLLRTDPRPWHAEVSGQ